MNQQLMTMAIGLGMSQVARRLDLDTPERLFGIRALYLATNIIIFCMYLYIAAKVSPTRPRSCFSDAFTYRCFLGANRSRQVRRKNDNTILKYVEPKPFSVSHRRRWRFPWRSAAQVTSLDSLVLISRSTLLQLWRTHTGSNR